MVDWSRSNDTYLYGLEAGSPLVVPEQLPPVKNELLRGEIDVTYEITRNIRLGVAYWFDDYNVEDFALGPDTLVRHRIAAAQSRPASDSDECAPVGLSVPPIHGAYGLGAHDVFVVTGPKQPDDHRVRSGL